MAMGVLPPSNMGDRNYVAGFIFHHATRDGIEISQLVTFRPANSLGKTPGICLVTHGRWKRPEK
jgi:hypothetical protein